MKSHILGALFAILLLSYSVFVALAYFHYIPFNIFSIILAIYTIIIFYMIKSKDMIIFSFMPIITYVLAFFILYVGNKGFTDEYTMAIMHSSVWIILAAAIRGNHFDSYRENEPIPTYSNGYTPFQDSVILRLIKVDEKDFKRIIIDNQSIIDTMNAYPEFKSIVFLSAERQAYKQKMLELKMNKSPLAVIQAHAYVAAYDSLSLKKSLESYQRTIENEMDGFNDSPTTVHTPPTHEKDPLDLFKAYETTPERAAAFSDWFAAQDFEGNDYYTWAATLNALTDGIDRSRVAHKGIINPVYVAVRTGTKYHKGNCSLLTNASLLLELDQAEAEERGFEACERCK